jgi:hypothetical protein
LVFEGCTSFGLSLAFPFVFCVMTAAISFPTYDPWVALA